MENYFLRKKEQGEGKKEERKRQKARFNSFLLFPFSLFLLLSLPSWGQSLPAQDPLVRQFDVYRQRALQEKLFLHTDRPDYLTGETMWFKAYYVDGTLHQPLALSKVAYVEILDGEGKSVLQTKLALTSQGGDGALFIPSSLRSGQYVLRAYTAWMKNFSADYFFEKPLTIVNPFRRLGLPPRPAAAPAYAIELFPEGGALVNGLPATVAFRVTDPAGKGVACSGVLLNSRNDTLARFRPLKFGLGRFSFLPMAGTTYRVVIKDDQGRTSTRPLPASQPQGYTMQVQDADAGHLRVTVRTSNSTPTTVYLLVHTRQAVKVAEGRPLSKETTFTLDKNALGDGISHLTVFDAARRPVAERLYFKRPSPRLALALQADKKEYAPRSKVELTVAAQAGSGNATELSIAVYKLDSLSAGTAVDLPGYLWLTSDLRGTVESPAYYLGEPTPEVMEATDNLMLTHGWRRFRWEDALSPTPVAFQYLPEVNGPLIQGQVTEMGSNKPRAGALAYLASPGKPIRLSASRSDSAGRVWFEMKDFYGNRDGSSRVILGQMAPEDSLYRLAITEPYSPQPAATVLPPFNLEESATQSLLARSVAMQVQKTYWDERLIRYQTPAVDSAAFYGKPTYTYRLDDYTRFPTMDDILREYVAPVQPRKRQGKTRLQVMNTPYKEFFETSGMVLIDGVPVFDMEKVMAFSTLKIQRLDVMASRYYYGPAQFDGLISFTTYTGDLAGFPLDPRLVKLDYDGLQLHRELYAPRYDTPAQQQSRLPDTRTLLYWNPTLRTDAQGNGAVNFFTSDEPGQYLIEINGLNAHGAAGSQRTRIEVKGEVR